MRVMMFLCLGAVGFIAFEMTDPASGPRKMAKGGAHFSSIEPVEGENPLMLFIENSTAWVKRTIRGEKAPTVTNLGGPQERSVIETMALATPGGMQAAVAATVTANLDAPN